MQLYSWLPTLSNRTSILSRSLPLTFWKIQSKDHPGIFVFRPMKGNECPCLESKKNNCHYFCDQKGVIRQQCVLKRGGGGEDEDNKATKVLGLL